MMHLEDQVLIDRPVKFLYALVSDLERHVSLLPGYSESRILSWEGDTCLLRREAIIAGHKRRWTSKVSFRPDRAIYFVQQEGPLRGMKVAWELIPEGQTTWLRITHDINVRPWWKKWWMERVVAKPAIETTARFVLAAIKYTAEENS